MFIEKSRFESIVHIENNIHLIKVHSPLIAKYAKPGQFCNIKVSDTDFPLLRRPFSVCNVEGEFVYFIFDIHGEGTRLLARKKIGDEIDILGPLGKGFDYTGDFDTAIIVAGGLGAAPFPFLTNYLSDKNIYSFIGGRTKNLVIKWGLKNVLVATDDGSEGYRGTNVELFQLKTELYQNKKFRIFACGPNAMLKTLQEICIKNNYECQMSVECAMACGFGICQGCPIEKYDEEGYLLVCKDGPVFDARMVKL